jgi:hypothetical protein
MTDLHRIRLLLAALLATHLSATLRAAPITIDGIWGNLGIHPHSDNWTPKQGHRVVYKTFGGGDGTGHGDPGWGESLFEAEESYRSIPGSTLQFALGTDFEPDGVVNGDQSQLPGHVFLSVSTCWDSWVDLGTGIDFTSPTGSSAQFVYSALFTHNGVTNIGSTPYSHEGYLDRNRVGGLSSDSVGVHGTMSSVNDVGDNRVPNSAVPEPATLCLLCVGGLAAVGLRRRRRP